MDVVKYLVSQGADVHDDNNCAIRWACANGYLDVAKYLVSQGANILADHNFVLKWAADCANIKNFVINTI